MAVVKADGYGHGAVPCARAALAAGAAWLGTATPYEALALRAAGIDAPLLCWLWTPGGPWRAAVDADVDVAVSGLWALDEVTEAARAAGRPARIQLKADTGLGRNGCLPADWPHMVGEALKAQADGLVRITGLWSHFACADEPGHPSVNAQLAQFHDMLEYAEKAGVEPEVRHMANSPATLTLPETHFDLVRTGVALYGISPAPELGTPADFGLRPVMRLSAHVASVKQAPPGLGISYGHHYVTDRDTHLALVPVGYADGVPRHASGRGPVLLGGKVRTAAGRIAMDQFVVDLGEDTVRVGDRAVLFGPGDDGEPTAEDWARAADTIAYEIVTRVGTRVPRVYLDADAGRDDDADADAGRDDDGDGDAGPGGPGGADA